MKNNFYKLQGKNGVVFYKNSLLDTVGIISHAFSTRLGGVSSKAYASLNLGVNSDDEKENVLQNFRLFSDAIGISTDSFVLSNQVHDDKIRIVTKEDMGKGVTKPSDIKGIDALITNVPGVALCTFYADCTPLLFVDPVKRVVASVHSGWRGTRLKIAKKTVTKMQEVFGCDPKDLRCAIGPSIKQCHFEVGEEVFDQFYEIFGEEVREHTLEIGEKFYINTDALNVSSLLDAGLLEENISVCNLCTFCKKDVFFSHRGDNGTTGRMCAVISLH